MAFSPTAAIGYLRRAHEQQRLAHAYLISGPAGAGKKQLAAELAELVNGTDRADVFSTSARDIFVAEPESKSRRIVIEQVRELEHTLQMRAVAGRRKVAIVSEADRLQPQAANAFLKTLEEPPNESLLLLLSDIPEALPETILSRCVAIPLEVNGSRSVRVEEKALLELLRKAAANPKWDIAGAYRLAQEFERLLRALRDEIKSETDETLQREEARYRNATDGAWLEEREDYYKALTESLYLRRRAKFIETLLVWWADILRAAAGIERRDLTNAKADTDAVAKGFTSTEILRRIRALEELRENLDRNIQEALAIEVAFLSVFVATKL
jgi:DNA polymerase III subunit delta'